MALMNLRHATEFDRLAETIIREARNCQLIYVPNRGNWGDGLIHAGTKQFLKYYGIEYREVPRTPFEQVSGFLGNTQIELSDALLLAGGGGAWCHHWFGSRELIKNHHQRFSKIIVLPTTYALPRPDLPEQKVTYFSRDQHHSRKSISDAIFCHDMAFFLDIELLNLATTDRDGFFFRTDKERHPNQRNTPPDNIDISRLGNESHPARSFFQLLSAYRSITTDRLHVGIAGSLMGIPTRLFSGDYFKTQAVYESSIKPNFAGTQFINLA